MARERKFTTGDLFLATEQILLQHGYEGFTFSLLAEQLEVSRGTIYKYFENREELITDYMIYEMEKFLAELKQMDVIGNFDEQFTFLLKLMFKNTAVPHMIEIGRRIPVNDNQKVKQNIERLGQLHFEMYNYCQRLITKGKLEQKIKTSIPDSIMIGMIFQSIMIPNRLQIPQSEWIASIKEMLCHGMLKLTN
ncbi:TetR/AcrR family transcriptional regulator [Neobacillus dielmonensis]|uniref:TetR/AcrR family transcriptional regulator n=1 Tax=Neobacillus dielmonensis TaxID=1347369 RepID=UPI0005A636E1|nr:TetR/AcrR family transcriptional regulator [Neobacillus dielmonensis]